MRRFSYAIAAALASFVGVATTANAEYSARVVSEPGTQVADPALAIAPDGTATVAWTAYRLNGFPYLRVARVEPDGTVGHAQAFPGAGANSQDVDLAVDPEGRVTAVWESCRCRAGSPAQIQMARIGADGTLGPAQTVGRADDTAAYQPRVAVDRSGRAVVVYLVDLGPQFGKSRARTRAVQVGVDGTPEAPIDISRIDARDSELAIDGQGRAVIAWSNGDFSSKRFPFRVQARTLLPDGSLGPLRTLSRRGQRGFDVDLDVSSAGRATVAWRSAHGKIFATRVNASGRVERGPQELTTSKSPDAGSPEVAVTGAPSSLGPRSRETTTASSAPASPGGARRSGRRRSPSMLADPSSSPAGSRRRRSAMSASNWARRSPGFASASRPGRPGGSSRARRGGCSSLTMALGVSPQQPQSGPRRANM